MTTLIPFFLSAGMTALISSKTFVEYADWLSCSWSAIKKQTVLGFTKNATEIIRDSILGVKTATGPRPGCNFEQSGVQIYDVEVIGVKVSNETVARLINESQQNTICGMLGIIKKQQEATVAKEIETAERSILAERQLTEVEKHKAAIEAINRKLEAVLADAKVSTERDAALQTAQLALTDIQYQINEKYIAKEWATAENKNAINTQIQLLEEKKLAMETEAIKIRLQAVDPKLVAAIESSNDRDALVSVVEKMGLGAYLKNDSVGATLSSILAGTPLEKTMAKLGQALKE
jgi:hypothetical protein